MDCLRTNVGGKVILEPVNDSHQANTECSTIEISGCSEVAFREFVARRSASEKLLLNSQGSLTLDDGSRCLVKLTPEGCCSYGLFDEEALRGVEIRVKEPSAEEGRIDEEVPVDTDVPVKSVAIE